MNFYGTLGMACAEEETLYQMFRAGMTGARLNLSHTSLKESGGLLNCFRAAAERAASPFRRLPYSVHSGDGRSLWMTAPCC